MITPIARESSVRRKLTVADVARVSSIHALSFPNGILTAFGAGCIEKYYKWHIEGPHAVETIGLEHRRALIGYCVLIRHNQLGGFIWRAWPRILGRLWNSPSLAIKRGFGARMWAVASLVLGRGNGAPQTDTMRILAIALHPDFRGLGLAQILLTAATDIARDCGAHALALSVHPENQRAIHAYDRDGWERVVVNGEWKGLMRKSLVRDSPRIHSIPVL